MNDTTTTTVRIAGVDAARAALGRILAGDFSARIDADFGSPELAQMCELVNSVVEVLENRVDQMHESSMDLALGLSECFQALADVRGGDLEARVGDATTGSKDELLAKFATTLNLTLGEVQQTIARLEAQRYAIESLSTPVLQIWDDVLALPIIGVVDSQRGSQIMEHLLQQIVAHQARFVILDITGVETVDTSTADHFIKVVRAAELLGAHCVVTGIQPAVAQTLVDLGVDLTRIRTLRTLKDGLKDCVRSLGARATPAPVKPAASDAK